MHKIKMSTEFDDNGHAIDYYFDHLYLSYQCKLMKPSAEIFNDARWSAVHSPGNALHR